MATTIFTTMIPESQPKKPGPPVPPRPQQSSLLKTQPRDASSLASSATTTTIATSQCVIRKVGLETAQFLNKIPIISNTSKTSTPITTSATTSVRTSGGRTIIYKSTPSNLKKCQEERVKRSEASTQTTASTITITSLAAAKTAKTKLTNGTQVPKPPLKLRKAPDVPTNFKPCTITPRTEVKENASKINDNNKSNTINNSKNINNTNNILIVQLSQRVVTLNRHHSMSSGSPQSKLSSAAKDTRLSLGKADFERIDKMKLQQLQRTSQPLPKPQKIVKVPLATLDVNKNTSSAVTSSSSPNTLHANLFKRSKTSIENFTSRSNISTVNTNSTGSYLSEKTVEIKNNFKNAAERLFSEIMVNQHKQIALESNIATNIIIKKHERAIQHKSAGTTKLNDAYNSNNIIAVTTAKDLALNNDHNYTHINITRSTNTADNLNIGRQVVSPFNYSEKKSAAFHDILISELVAMHNRSCSMENLQTATQLLQPQQLQPANESAIDKQVQNYKQFKTIDTQFNTVNNKQQQHHDDYNDADNIEDADGDIEDDLKKSLKIITSQNTPRKRTQSGCSSDFSPYGTERSVRIRTSDSVEVADNGTQVSLTSCHISLEASGLEDEERMDEMYSSNMGDSWDIVIEAEQQKKIQLEQQHFQQEDKRARNIKRWMSF